MLRRAESVGSSLRSLAYEAEWAKMLGTGTQATQRPGWQLLSASRPQVGCHVPESLMPTRILHYDTPHLESLLPHHGLSAVAGRA